MDTITDKALSQNEPARSSLWALIRSGSSTWIFCRRDDGSWAWADPDSSSFPDTAGISRLPLRQRLVSVPGTGSQLWYEADTSPEFPGIEIRGQGNLGLSSSEYAFLTHVPTVLQALERQDALGLAQAVNHNWMSLEDFVPVLKPLCGKLAAGALIAWELGLRRTMPDFASMWQQEAAETADSGITILGSPDRGSAGGLGAWNGNGPSPQTKTDHVLYRLARLEPWFSPEERQRLKANAHVPQVLSEVICRKVLQGMIEGPGLTVPLVGTFYHPWVRSRLSPLMEEAQRRSSQEWFEPLGNSVSEGIARFARAHQVCIQAEPYNPHDRNALGVIMTNSRTGQNKAGYLNRQLAAAIRQTLPGTLSYPGRIEHIGQDPDGEWCFAIRIGGTAASQDHREEGDKSWHTQADAS